MRLKLELQHTRCAAEGSSSAGDSSRPRPSFGVIPRRGGEAGAIYPPTLAWRRRPPNRPRSSSDVQLPLTAQAGRSAGTRRVWQCCRPPAPPNFPGRQERHRLAGRHHSTLASGQVDVAMTFYLKLSNCTQNLADDAATAEVAAELAFWSQKGVAVDRPVHSCTI